MADAPRYKDTYNKSHALVIGIDDYPASLPPLRAAVHGAESVARLLRESLGFDVTLLRNAEATREAIEGHIWGLKNTHPDDRVLIYFAGHGITDTTVTGDKVGFLVPYGVEAGAYARAIEMDYLVDRSKYIPAKHILFVLDACFSGLALTTRSGKGEHLLKDLMTRRTVQAIAAGQEDQEVVDGGPGGCSVFTGLLLERLEQRGGLLTGMELGLYLQRQVASQTRKRQTPHYGSLLGSRGGDFVFWAEETVVELPADLRAAIESPYAGIRHGAVVELERLLKGSNPDLARRAREALTRLADDDSRMVSEAARRALGEAPQPPPVVEVVTPPKPAQPPKPRTRRPLEPKWVEVPAGPFLMGSDKKKDPLAIDDELPQHEVNIPYAYRIGKYPVTNAEFLMFVEAMRRKWQPREDLSKKMNHPVVWVSWFDAMAYCR